jgi:hypothetical protein
LASATAAKEVGNTDQEGGNMNLATHARTYNYFALTAAILNPKFSVEDAINKFSPATEKHKVDNSTTIEMMRLKQTMTYKEIGCIYGIRADAVYNRIRRYKGGLANG